MVAALGAAQTGRQDLLKDVYRSFETFSDCFQMKSNKI